MNEIAGIVNMSVEKRNYYDVMEHRKSTACVLKPALPKPFSHFYNGSIHDSKNIIIYSMHIEHNEIYFCNCIQCVH